jgi:spore coat protein H
VNAKLNARCSSALRDSWLQRSRGTELWLILTALAAGVVQAATSSPATGTPNDFFGLTNLYEFHLTIASEEWATMNTFDSPGRPQFGDRGLGQFEPGRGEGPRPPGFEGGPPRPPGPPMMGLDFKEGKAALRFEGKDWGAVSVRFKGNSSFNISRNTLKKSLKLDFNDAEKGRKFFGMTKLNLNNGAMDPSVLREALAYDVFRRAGVPASRTAFARVFITVPGKYEREYAGLYTVVEQVDGTFLKARFGDKSGLLLKPERVNGLPYLGDNWAAYVRQFEEKSGSKPKETKRFISFVRLVNLAGDAEFARQIDSFMDVDEFLRFLAVQTVLANLDSPLLTGHNYYLYLNSATDKLAWIPWDLNEAFGGFMGGGRAEDMMDLSIHKPFTRGNRLAERILALDGATQKYDAILRGLIATNFTAQRLGEEMEAAANVIREAVRQDRSLSLAQFERHLSENPGPVVAGDGLPMRRGVEPGFGPPRGGPGPGGRGPMGPKPFLRQFVTKRIESIKEQLAGTREGYVPVQMNRPPGRGGPGQ